MKGIVHGCDVTLRNGGNDVHLIATSEKYGDCLCLEVILSVADVSEVKTR